MKRILNTLINSTIYSSTLSTTLYISDKDYWTRDRVGHLILFWIGFMVPSGILWGQVNKFIFQNRNPFLFFANKKDLMKEVFLNHVGYQLISIPALYFYLTNLKGDIYKEKEIQGEIVQLNDE